MAGSKNLISLFYYNGTLYIDIYIYIERERFEYKFILLLLAKYMELLRWQRFSCDILKHNKIIQNCMLHII